MRLIRSLMKGLVGIVILAFLAPQLMAACKATVHEATKPTTTTAVGVTTPAGAVPTNVADVKVALANLTVATPQPDGYDRDAFKHWSDLDSNGCDARADVLITESTTAAQVDRSGGCTVVAGDWVSVYDNVTTDNPGDLDVDHMVPLKNAWMSGARNWSPQQRERYANDLTYPDHLIAVTASSNRSKGDKSPDQWKPPNQAVWCRYATDWVTIKTTWQLTVTDREKAALGDMLATCPTT